MNMYLSPIKDRKQVFLYLIPKNTGSFQDKETIVLYTIYSKFFIIL